MKNIRKIACLMITAVGLNANAAMVTYEYSVSADTLFSYTLFDGVDGTTAAENGIYDGARLSRHISGNARSYIESENEEFESWITTTDQRMTTLNFWGFDGRGAGWGEDFKHTSRAMVSAPGDWSDWSTGWLASWGANPNPNTDQTPGWYANSFSSAIGVNDTNLISQLFTFQLTFDDTDWLYGEETFGAPNDLDQGITLWFGGWMGSEDNLYEHIYEGNLVLQGTRVEVPEPPVVAIASLGILCMFARRRFATSTSR